MEENKNLEESLDKSNEKLNISDVSKQSEQLIDLIKKAQTPRGNVVIDYLMKEYKNQKIN
jgi:hypothetical protein